MTAPISVAQATRIRLRRAWTEDWERVNPILSNGEPGYDKTKNMLKIGDGVTPWRQLPFLNPPPTAPMIISGDVAMESVMKTHVDSPAPHPVYDNGPSLLLLYQNAKV